MAKKQYWKSEAKNARWIKEGRGQGCGKDYKPWFTVRDDPSEDRAHRILVISLTAPTTVSDLELATFLLLQWSNTDVRE